MTRSITDIRHSPFVSLARTVPLVMSALALALVVEGLWEFGSHPPADEGWQAHIFQLLLAAQLPLIAAHAVWGERRLSVLIAHAALWIAAAGAAAYLFP